jgi:hypothetical protein
MSARSGPRWLGSWVGPGIRSTERERRYRTPSMSTWVFEDIGLLPVSDNGHRLITRQRQSTSAFSTSTKHRHGSCRPRFSQRHRIITRERHSTPGSSMPTWISKISDCTGQRQSMPATSMAANHRHGYFAPFLRSSATVQVSRRHSATHMVTRTVSQPSSILSRSQLTWVSDWPIGEDGLVDRVTRQDQEHQRNAIDELHYDSRQHRAHRTPNQGRAQQCDT